VPSTTDIGSPEAVKTCETPNSLNQIMLTSYIIEDSNVDGAVTMAILELQLVSRSHEDGVALKLLARLPYA
jgi:hypothetical protein